MTRRLPWWLLVGWAAAVAVAIPLLAWGGVTGVEYLTGRSRYVTAASASISGDLIAVASVNAGRVAALHTTAGGTVRQGDALAGYAIFGRSGTVGYVQRLAVAPLHRAQGVGRGLMLDGLALVC